MLRASWTGTDILGTEKGGRAGCRCLYRKERSSNFLKTSLSLVGMKGFEPSTFGLEVHCSIQLSYGRKT